MSSSERKGEISHPLQQHFQKIADDFFRHLAAEKEQISVKTTSTGEVKKETKRSETSSTADVKDAKTASTAETKSDVKDVKSASTAQTKLPYDLAIFKKYGVKKYIVDLAGEKYEAWVYDDKSDFTKPILEDQLIKRAQSLVAAAKHFTPQEYHGLLSKMEYEFTKKIWTTTKLNMKNAMPCIKELLNDIALLADKSGVAVLKEQKQLDHFFETLLAESEKPPFAAFKHHHILAVNLREDVRSVQIYERGEIAIAQPEDTKKQELKRSEQKPETKSDSKDVKDTKAAKRAAIKERIRKFTTQSAHKRDETKGAVSNLIVYGTGGLDKKGNPVITETGFRHASLPSIDLFEKNEYKNKNTVDVTERNMAALFAQMHERLNTKEPIIWCNVGLLTVHDRENQDRQYEETTLAADLIRAKTKDRPIIFNYGINGFALSQSGVFSGEYPKIQAVENMRSLFRLMAVFLRQIKARDKESGDKKIHDEIDSILNELENTTTITLLLRCIENLDSQIKSHIEEKPNHLKTLKEKKESQDTQIENFYSGFLKFMPDYIYKLMAIDTRGKELSPQQKTLFLLFDDLQSIFEYLRPPQLGSVVGSSLPKWMLAEHNMKLQTYLIDFINQLSKLNPRIVSSFNCKSNNDRSSAEAIRLDLFRHERVTGKNIIDPKIKMVYCAGSASAHSAGLDTDGGGPKFGAKTFDAGHPSVGFAAKQEKTEKLATHKFYKKYCKGLPLPQRFMLIDLEVNLIRNLSAINSKYKTDFIKFIDGKKTELKSNTSVVKKLYAIKKFVTIKLDEFEKGKLNSPVEFFDAFSVFESKENKDSKENKALDIAALEKLKMEFAVVYLTLLKGILVDQPREKALEKIKKLTSEDSKVYDSIQIHLVSEYSTWMILSKSFKTSSSFSIFSKISAETKNVNDNYKCYNDSLSDDKILQLRNLEALNHSINIWLHKNKQKSSKAITVDRAAMLALRLVVLGEKAKVINTILKPAAAVKRLVS